MQYGAAMAEVEADWGSVHFATIFSELAEIDEMENPYALGGWIGALPDLGPVTWPTAAELRGGVTPFRFHLARMPEGPLVGFLRFGHFQFDDRAMEWFAHVMPGVAAQADILVIDVMQHVGGSLLRTYEVLSFLADRPLDVPLHEIVITEARFEAARAVLRRAEAPGPGDRPPSSQALRFARFIIDETEAGRARFRDPESMASSRPGPVFGIDRLEPARGAFAGPILVLTDEMTFSAGEFFAAILKDNGRCTLFGRGTAGGGGLMEIVKPQDTEFSEFLGLMHFTLRWTLAHRTNGLIIEQAGVAPDISYEQTVEDIRENRAPMRRAVAETILSMLG